MKKVIIIVFWGFLYTQNNVSAQDVISIFGNDGLINEFLIEDVDSIVCIEEGFSIAPKVYDTQVVYTKYGTYNIQMNLIDSISLQQPIANGYVLNPEDLEDWDEGYVYQSTNDDDMTVACAIKRAGDEMLMYLNRLNALHVVEEGYIFVLGNDGTIKKFVHNGIYFSLTYDNNNDISIQGIDTLGNEVFNYRIDNISYAHTQQKRQRAISLDNIKNGYDIFSKIFNGLDMANMAGRGAWKEFFYSLFKTGIDMSKYFKKYGGPFIKVLEIANQLVSYDMRNQLYRSCKISINNVKNNSSNSAIVSLDIQSANTLSYVYYEPQYKHLSTKYEDPFISVPRSINQYYAGIVAKKNRSDVSYGDYDIRLPLNTINKTTSSTSLTLSGLEVGEKYYLKPYVIADMLVSDNDFWDFLDGGILYGSVYEYVFNGISIDFNQTSCTYLGKNEMGISFNLSAEIAALKDVSAWGVTINDKNGKEIGTYYAESGSSNLDIDEHMVLDKDIFNSDNVAEIKLCPFYIYGYYLTPIYLESVLKKIEWEVTVETKDAVNIDDNTVDINCYVEGFDMTNAPNDCAIGVLYRTIPGVSVENSNAVISNQKSGGDITITLRELENNKDYYYRSYVRIEEKYYYGDEKSFTLYHLCPVSITSVTTTAVQYRPTDHPQHFIYKDSPYEFKYDVSTTVKLIDDEGVENWGYVYEGPYEGDKKSRISLMGANSEYKDTRFPYYRNGSPTKHTVRLYPFVKYTGDDEYYYGEPVDYPLIYPETSTVELTACSTGDVVTREHVEYNGVTYDYCSTFILDYNATGAYWITVGAEETGSGWNGWDPNLPARERARAADGSNRLTINYYYNQKKMEGDYLLRIKGIDERHNTSCTSSKSVKLTHNGKTFTGCELIQ